MESQQGDGCQMSRTKGAKDKRPRKPNAGWNNVRQSVPGYSTSVHRVYAPSSVNRQFARMTSVEKGRFLEKAFNNPLVTAEYEG